MFARMSVPVGVWVGGLAVLISLGVAATVAFACDDCITVIDVPAWDEHRTVTDIPAWDEQVTVNVPAYFEETTLDHPAVWVPPVPARTIAHHDLVTPGYTVVIPAHDDPYQVWIVSHIVDYQWIDTSHYVPVWVDTSWDEYYEYWQSSWCWSDYIEDFYDCGYWAGAYRHHTSGYWDQQWVTSGYEQQVTIDTSHFEARYNHVAETSYWVPPVYDDWIETIAGLPGYWIPAYSEPLHIFHEATTRVDIVHHNAVTHDETVHHIAVGHLQRLGAGSTQSTQGAPPAPGGSGASGSIVTEPVRIPIVTTLSLVDRPAYTETVTIVDQPAWDESVTVVDQPAYDESVTVVDTPARTVTTTVVDTPASTIAHHDLVTAATTVNRQVVDVPGHYIQRAYIDGHYEQIRFFVPSGHWATEWVCTNGYTDNWEGDWHCTAGYYHDVWKDTSYWVEPPDYRTVTWIPGSYVTTTTYVNSGHWIPDNCGATQYWWCAAHWQSDAHYVYPSDVWVDPTYTTVTDQVPAVYRDWVESVPAVTHTVTTEIPAVTRTVTVHHDAMTHTATIHHDAATHTQTVAHAPATHDQTLSLDATVVPDQPAGNDNGLADFAALMGLVALAGAGRLRSTRDVVREALTEWSNAGRSIPLDVACFATNDQLTDAQVADRVALIERGTIGRAAAASIPDDGSGLPTPAPLYSLSWAARRTWLQSLETTYQLDGWLHVFEGVMDFAEHSIIYGGLPYFRAWDAAVLFSIQQGIAASYAGQATSDPSALAWKRFFDTLQIQQRQRRNGEQPTITDAQLKYLWGDAEQHGVDAGAAWAKAATNPRRLDEQIVEELKAVTDKYRTAVRNDDWFTQGFAAFWGIPDAAPQVPVPYHPDPRADRNQIALAALLLEPQLVIKAAKALHSSDPSAALAAFIWSDDPSATI
jgi:hypothetical protein